MTFCITGIAYTSCICLFTEPQPYFPNNLPVINNSEDPGWQLHTDDMAYITGLLQKIQYQLNTLHALGSIMLTEQGDQAKVFNQVHACKRRWHPRLKDFVIMCMPRPNRKIEERVSRNRHSSSALERILANKIGVMNRLLRTKKDVSKFLMSFPKARAKARMSTRHVASLPELALVKKARLANKLRQDMYKFKTRGIIIDLRN